MMSSESEKRAVAISTNYRWLWFALGVLCALVMLTGFGALAQAGLLGVGLAVWSTVHLAPLLGFAMGLVSTTWYAVITAVSGLTALAMLREFWQPGYLWGRLSKLWRARKVQRNLKRSFKMTFGDRVEDQSRMLFDGWMRKMWPGFACGKKPKSVTLPIFASIEIVVSLWTIVESPFVDENDFGYAVGLLFLSVLELVLNPFQALLSVLDIVENLVNQCWEFFAESKKPQENFAKRDDDGSLRAYRTRHKISNSQHILGFEKINHILKAHKDSLQIRQDGEGRYYLKVKVGQDESTTSSMIALGSNGKFKVTIRPAGKSHVFVRGGKFVTGLLIDTLRFVLECLDDVYKFIPRLIYQYWKDTSFPQKSEKEPETFSALDLGRVGPCAFPCWVEPGNGDIPSKLDLTAFLSDGDEDAAFNGFQGGVGKQPQ